MFNKSIDVYWSPLGGINAIDMKQNKPAVDILWFEPEPLLKHLVKERDKQVTFLRCPAVQDLYKNTYVIRSPIDMKFSILRDDKGNCIIREHLNSPRFFNDFVTHRNPSENSRFPMLSIAIDYLMYSNKELEAEVLPPTLSMHISSGLKGVNLICGKFDISKWIRPLEVAFEIHDDTDVIEIKRGDPLYYIRFNTKKKINFIRKEVDDSVIETMMSCLIVKDYVRGNNMQQNYELAAPLIKFKKSVLFKKKCPFGFGK